MDYINSQSLYLCIDQGGHASRAIVFDIKGEIISSAYCNIETQHPEAKYVELKADELIRSIKSALHQVIEKLGEKRNHLVAVGIATQRSNIVCWNKETGQALSPIISWQDSRNSNWLDKLNDKNEDIHKRTGLFMSPHYGASKLRWCIDNLSEVKHALKNDTLAFGPMASFIVYKLVKEKPFVVDPVNASRTQLWNLKQNNWDNELLKLFGIPRAALPECVPSFYEYGNIEIDNFSLPLRLLTGDQSAAMYAYGKLQPDTAYVNTGTGAFLSRPSGSMALHHRRLLTSIILQNKVEAKLENQYVLEGTINGAGSALEWLNPQYPDSSIFEHLSAWLNEVKQPALFLNGISGLAAPFWQSDFQSRFITDSGINKEFTVSEKAVAIIESIVFLLKVCLDEMSILSSPPEQIQLSGGLATLNGLNQRLADITLLPVYRPAECEATARGTAYLLSNQPAHWPEQSEGQWFNPHPNPALQSRYKSWKQAMLKQLRVT